MSTLHMDPQPGSVVAVPADGSRRPAASPSYEPEITQDSGEKNWIVDRVLRPRLHRAPAFRDTAALSNVAPFPRVF